MRLWDDAAHATTLATTDDTNYYDAIGANLVLELRLTWRLDRLLYAGDEPTLERVRLERQDARARVATRTLEVLFAWQRAARREARQAAAGSPEELEAELRAAEAEATLDVLTGGLVLRAGDASPAATPEAPPGRRHLDPRGPRRYLGFLPMLSETRDKLADLQRRLMALRGHL